MSSESPSGSTSTPRGRGRGRSRGGHGKYLRARGRRGGGRPAEFRERLLLEGEEPEELDEEEVAEHSARYSRRQLGSNADRYAEPEPELGSDGEPVVEPEVDLSGFLERQRISDDKDPGLGSEPVGLDDEDDVDHSLAHIIAKSKQQKTVPQKGKIETLEWDEKLESMAREKAAAEATWDLKDRFRAKSAKLRNSTIPGAKERKANSAVVEAPALPTSAPPKDPKTEMEDFLDDLLG
ncbi:hypothetical protein P691DRAFT_671077 [Macrolepiota fuliginosa MF-IS2]|uniref:Uncharacterized protein n=1 Tax=Macrolepiota fuliginosa MF-IS2 TaxID=1400762 RepID=A0A9P5XAC2_9AGAR|nr:hypothetical protein P691DRAFT_671077 [Macrolepiota fuliginosa MF-IS2]